MEFLVGDTSGQIKLIKIKEPEGTERKRKASDATSDNNGIIGPSIELKTESASIIPNYTARRLLPPNGRQDRDYEVTSLSWSSDWDEGETISDNRFENERQFFAC